MKLYEILKDAPDGLSMYSPAYGWVKVYKRGLKCNTSFRLEADGKTVGYLDENGKIAKSGQLMLFPSSNCTWANWAFILMKQPQCVGFLVCDETDGEVFKITDKPSWFERKNGDLVNFDFYNRLRFATPDERKTFYKKPTSPAMLRIAEMLKPGDRVLVRKYDGEESNDRWEFAHFAYFDKESELFVTGESICSEDKTCDNIGYAECIPFNNGTNVLLYTTINPLFVDENGDVPVIDFTTD